MITIHHLGASQSDRVVWLMEELGLPYDLKWYSRGPDRLAPQEYLDLHPVATAPVIEDGELVLTESAVILEHICHRHAGGRLTVGPRDPNYTDYLFWMQFNNSVLGLYFAQTALAAGAGAGAADDPVVQRMTRVVGRRRDRYHAWLDQTLGRTPYLAGQDLTCADIMIMFNLTTLPLFAGQDAGAGANIAAYVDRVSGRPAYRRAMEIAGPKAVPPAG